MAKASKAYHDENNNALTIPTKNKIVTLNTLKKTFIFPSRRPCNFNYNHYWENGLIDNDEEHLYQVVPKLWPIGDVSPNDLKFVLKIFYAMLQPNKTLNYLVWSYHHELEKMLILYEYANVTIKNK